jgi:hypothetical protein
MKNIEKWRYLSKDLNPYSVKVLREVRILRNNIEDYWSSIFAYRG